MEHDTLNESRRDFLTKVLPLASILCLGCKRSALKNLVSESPEKGPDIGISTEETYSFFYSMFIPILQSLQQEIGNEKFIEVITKSSTENLTTMINAMTEDFQEKDLNAFASLLKDVLATPPYNTSFTCEIVEHSDKVFELKYNQCLPAKLLKAMNAADIGLAIECSGAEAAAKAFNPKIKFSNPKNIMKGDSYCIERFTFKT